METTSSEHPSIHPKFTNDEADTTLLSNDQIAYQIHSVVLKLTSGWFRNMFTLPQTTAPNRPNHPSPQPTVTLYLDEPSNVLTGLLCIISGFELPEISTVDYAEALLYAAEKYDMPGPISLIRKLITQEPLISSSPLRAFGLASKWDWKEEAKIASTLMLDIDLCSDAAFKEMQRTPITPLYLVALMRLQRKRRDMIKDGLNGPTFAANQNYNCGSCGASNIHKKWEEFKSKCMEESETRPFGHRLTMEDLLDHRGYMAALLSTCPNAQCSKNIYDFQLSIRRLIEVIEKLPSVCEI